MTILFALNCDRGGKLQPGKIETKAIVAKAPIVESQVAEPVRAIPQNKAKDKVVRPGAEAALEVRKSYLMPILERIWNTPVKCDQIADDPAGFAEMQEIHTRYKADERKDDKVYQPIEEDLHQGKNLDKVEKTLQEGLKGFIRYSPSSSYTINELAKIYEKYPCSEAGLVALLDISTIIWAPDYLYVYLGDSWSEPENKLSGFIMNNYPNTWEGRKVKLWHEKGRAKNELAKAALFGDFIAFAESNNLMNNKYYALFCQRDEPAANGIADGYSQMTFSYLVYGQQTGMESLRSDGRVSQEAIDACQKWNWGQWNWGQSLS